MRRLMLLRHAKSDWPDSIADHDRPLAKRGQRQTPDMARYLALHGLIPDLVIVSTARRTQETWQLIQPAFAQEVKKRDDDRIYEAPTSRIHQVLREADDAAHVLLMIGHNPGFNDLTNQLIVQDQTSSAIMRLQRGYPTLGLAVIDFKVDHWADVADGTGRLERFETPASISE